MKYLYQFLAFLFLWGAHAHAQGLNWQTDRTSAWSEAVDRGKLILLVAGRTDCVSCTYMRDTVCEDPSVRPLLDENFVPWFSDVDASNDWAAYAVGLGVFPLPLICVIEPGDINGYIDRTTSWTFPTNFLERLTARLPSVETRITDFKITAQNVAVQFSADPGATYRVRVGDRVLDIQSLTSDRLSGNPILFSGPSELLATPDTPSLTPPAHGWLSIIGFRPESP